MTPTLRARYSWATPEQLECISLFCDLVGGAHNLNGHFLNIGGDGVCISQRRSFATFDNDWLTRAVILAHQRGVRVEIQSGGVGALRVILHKRKGPEGRLMDRHPTLDQILEKYRLTTQEPQQ